MALQTESGNGNLNLVNVPLWDSPFWGREGWMFFSRHSRPTDVRPGTVFERAHGDNLVEFAEVEWVGAGPLGIPHVRYQAAYHRPGIYEPLGTRLLALASFAERFRPAEQRPAVAVG